RHLGETYWARPVPGFGDPAARLLLVGLAPAAQGANRTGRRITGDRSGDWLYRALHKAGFANQPHSVSRGDGMHIIVAYTTSAVRCAPPDNNPTREEHANCRDYLLREWRLLSNVRVVLGLGKIGFDAACQLHYTQVKPRPRFGHGT